MGKKTVVRDRKKVHEQFLQCSTLAFLILQSPNQIPLDIGLFFFFFNLNLQSKSKAQKSQKTKQIASNFFIFLYQCRETMHWETADTGINKQNPSKACWHTLKQAMLMLDCSFSVWPAGRLLTWQDLLRLNQYNYPSTGAMHLFVHACANVCQRISFIPQMSELSTALKVMECSVKKQGPENKIRTTFLFLSWALFQGIIKVGKDH